MARVILLILLSSLSFQTIADNKLDGKVYWVGGTEEIHIVSIEKPDGTLIDAIFAGDINLKKGDMVTVTKITEEGDALEITVSGKVIEIR